MAKIVVKSKVKKIKKKFPVEFFAPKMFNSQKLGESKVTDLSKLNGKTLKLNMMYVTGNMRNQSNRLTFRITDIDSGKANMELSQYEIIPYYLTRHIKKDVSLIEDSFSAKSKDGRELTLKPFLVTKKKASSLTISNIRKKLKELIKAELATKNFEDFQHEIVLGKYQLSLKSDLRYLLQLKVVEFKKLVLKK